MRIIDYDRQAAVRYARQWALSRNPAFFDFQGIGGDCTNFVSQAVYAGAGVMNYTRDVGWYFLSSRNRAAAWTGVEYFYKFMANNTGAGPFAREDSIGAMLPGDVIQLDFTGSTFEHSLAVVYAGQPPTPANILIATHSYDSLNRPLSTYNWKRIRFLRIVAVRDPQNV